MELRHLRYFIAVAEELNFRRAAERLHVSAPTLSQQIKDLEDVVGVRLLERDTTQVRLTGPGAILLEEAKDVIQRAEEAIQNTREAAQGRRGILRIGNAGPLSHGFMPACLQTFSAAYPGVDIVLVEIDLNDQIKAVSDGDLEIGFTLARNERALNGLNHHLVINKPLRVVLDTAHPLARRKRISLKDLVALRILAIGGTRISTHSQYIQQVFAGRGIEISPPKAVNGYEAFLAMVASGQGISLLQQTPSFNALEGLTTRPLTEKGPDLQFEARVVWRANQFAPITENFISVLRTVRP